MSTLIMRGHYDSPPYGPGGPPPPGGVMPRRRSNSDLGPPLPPHGGRRGGPPLGAPYGPPMGGPPPGVGGPYGGPPMHPHHHSPPYGAYPPPHANDGMYPPPQQRYDGGAPMRGGPYPPMGMGPPGVGGVPMPMQMPLIDLSGGPAGSGPNSLRRPTRRRRRSRQSTDVKRTKRENKRSIMLVGLTPEQCGSDEAIKDLVKQFGDVQLIERLDDNRCYVRFDSYPQALDALDAGVCGNGTVLIKSKHDHLKQLGVTTAETAEITAASNAAEPSSLEAVKEEDDEEDEVEGQVVKEGEVEGVEAATAKEDAKDEPKKVEKAEAADKAKDAEPVVEEKEGAEASEGSEEGKPVAAKEGEKEAKESPKAKESATATAAAPEAVATPAAAAATATAATATTPVASASAATASKPKKIVPSQTKSASATLMAERRASQAAASAQAAAAATHLANGGIPSRRPLVPSLSLDGRSHPAHASMRMGSRSQSLAPGALGMPPHPRQSSGGGGAYPAKARNSRRHSEALHFDMMRGRSSSNPGTMRKGPDGSFYAPRPPPLSTRHTDNPYMYPSDLSLSPRIGRHPLSPEGPTGLVSPTSAYMLDRGYDFAPPHMHTVTRSRTLPNVANRGDNLKKKLNVVKASEAPKSEAAVEMKRAVRAALALPDTPKNVKKVTIAEEKNTDVVPAAVDEGAKGDAGAAGEKPKPKEESPKAKVQDADEHSDKGSPAPVSKEEADEHSDKGSPAPPASKEAEDSAKKTAVERWIVHEGERSKRAAQFRAEFESKFDGEKRFDRNRRSEIAHKQRAEVYGDLAFAPPLSPPSPQDIHRKRLPYDYYMDPYYHPRSPTHRPMAPHDFDAAAAAYAAAKRDAKYFMRARSQSLAPHMDMGAVRSSRNRSGSLERREPLYDAPLPQVHATPEELAKAQARGISASSYLRNKAKYIALRRNEQLKREYAARVAASPRSGRYDAAAAAALSPRHIDPVKMFALKSGESIGIIDEAPPGARGRSQSLTAEYFLRQQQRGRTIPPRASREGGHPHGVLSRVRSSDTIGLGGDLPLNLLHRAGSSSLQHAPHIASVPEEGEGDFKLVPVDSPQNAKVKPGKKPAAAKQQAVKGAGRTGADASPKQPAAKVKKQPAVEVNPDHSPESMAKRLPQVSPRYVAKTVPVKANGSPPPAAAKAASVKDVQSPPKDVAAKPLDAAGVAKSKMASQANRKNSLKRNSVQGLAKAAAAASGAEEASGSGGKDGSVPIVAKGPDGSSGFNWQHNPKFNPFSRSAAE